MIAVDCAGEKQDFALVIAVRKKLDQAFSVPDALCLFVNKQLLLPFSTIVKSLATANHHDLYL